VANTLTFENFIPEVRAYIRDFKELNRLISGYETSDRLIQYCVHLAIDEFNTTPPLLGTFQLGSFPSRTILLDLTIVRILISVGLLKSRNRFSYSDGGWSSDTEQQDSLYQQWIQFLRSQSQPRMEKLKIALNIEGGWGGGVGSEYGWIHGWYGLS
jgi:hypothetical protein